MVVGDDDCVDKGQVFDFAWWWGVAFQAFDFEWRAAVFEYGVEEDAEARGEFDVVAGVAEPSGSEGVGWLVSCAVECWCSDWDGGRGCVGDVGFAFEFSPNHSKPRLNNINIRKTIPRIHKPFPTFQMMLLLFRLFRPRQLIGRRSRHARDRIQRRTPNSARNRAHLDSG